MKISRIIEELNITLEKYGDINAMVFVTTAKDSKNSAFRLQRGKAENDGGEEVAILDIEYSDDIKSLANKDSLTTMINKTSTP